MIFPNLIASLVTELVVVGIFNTIFLVLFVIAGIRQMKKEREKSSKSER